MKVSLLDKWMFAKMVVFDPALSSSAKCVAIAILEWRNDKSGRCFPSYETIGECCGLKRRMVFNAVQELKASGWLDYTSRPGRTHANEYVFNFKKVQDLAPFHPTEKVHYSTEKVHDRAHQLIENPSSPKEEKKGDDDGINASSGADRPDGRPPREALIQEGFAEFWQAYPRHVSIEAARRAYKHLVETGKATAAQILHGAKQYTDSKPRRPKDPDRWLWDGNYADELQAEPQRQDKPRKTPARKQSFAELMEQPE